MSGARSPAAAPARWCARSAERSTRRCPLPLGDREVRSLDAVFTRVIARCGAAPAASQRVCAGGMTGVDLPRWPGHGRQRSGKHPRKAEHFIHRRPATM